MTAGKKNPKVDALLKKSGRWQKEIAKLRTIVLSCGLTEELKWYQPCYTVRGNNALIIGSFKECCTISFFKGALLKDARGLLGKPGANTQAVRMMRFDGLGRIRELEPVIREYILEAVEAEKAGKKVRFKTISEHPVPDELQEALDESPALKKAFKALTPGRQRAYLLHFSSPKLSRTRHARIDKHRKRILDGKGLQDR